MTIFWDGFKYSQPRNCIRELAALKMSSADTPGAERRRSSGASDAKWAKAREAAAQASQEKVERRRSSIKDELSELGGGGNSTSPRRRLFDQNAQQGGGERAPETHEAWRERMQRQQAESEAATAAAKAGLQRFNFSGDRW